MNKTTKATLWILGVFAALSMAVYFAGCGDDAVADAGTPAVECAKEGDTCTGGKCYKKTGTEDLTCNPECTTVGDACEGGNCYFANPGMYCFATGDKALGDTCGAINDCGAGLQCTEVDGASACYQVCGTCETGECTDTTLGYSVCLETAE